MKGSGFRRRILKSIFKPFVRMKNSKIKHTGGAGIGLSVVKDIMDIHIGKIQVESCPGKGSSFSLYFCLSKGDL
ncbi:MAG: sensor histidine kinase [Ignavibacteria bacterium]|nr:sensor histidine kinase [Ignavibacteria bacterium]